MRSGGFFLLGIPTFPKLFVAGRDFAIKVFSSVHKAKGLHMKGKGGTERETG